jgi:hypothetical protein
MSLLEINQIRHISAPVRLDESTAAEVDHYAVFIPASADDVVDTALNYVFSQDLQMHMFTGRVGIQMLLMNTLEPPLRGDAIAPDQLTILFRQVQTTKAAKAQELLAKRSQNKER